MTYPSNPALDAIAAEDELTRAGADLALTDKDPGGLAASVQATVSAVLLAVGFAADGAARWALAASLVVGLVTQLWARRHAWAPTKVWLEATAARAAGETAGYRLATGFDDVPTTGAVVPPAALEGAPGPEAPRKRLRPLRAKPRRR